VVLLRRKFNRPLALLDRTDPGQPLLGFAEVLGGKQEVWEYAALVTSLDSEILTLGQLYRDRADCENAFDELKNHWGWGGFNTQDLKRCRLLAASVALIYNWWSLFVRLADPDQHREVITSRPLLLQAIARKTQHAGRTTLSVSSTHGEQRTARRAYLPTARVFCRVARKSGAVGRRAALVPHLERGTAKISARPAIDPARTPAAGLTPPATVANRGANCRRAWGQLPDLGSILEEKFTRRKQEAPPRRIQSTFLLGSDWDHPSGELGNLRM